ncbi:Chorismate mutase type II [uncultured archaeon]|nr:Chorismate mutase type II [uncultured archaeon]
MTECKSIDEVRENIDSIDREIVRLLSERRRYVKQAAGFKKTREDVRAPKRVEEVIAKVRTLASEREIDPDIVEKVYRTMIACFIECEMKEHDKSQ